MVRDRDAKNRRLAAIVFTDIVGFSALVNRDEILGARALDLQRRIIRRLVPAFGGREIETAGDSFLLEFSSTFAALRCVVAIQHALKREPAAVPGDPPVRLRASIHLGDIEHRGREVFGDGVNIAARLMPMSPEGGIAISDQVHSQIRHRLDVAARSLGLCELKNIRYPVEVFVFDDTAVDAIPIDVPGAGQSKQSRPRHQDWSRLVPVLLLVLVVLCVGLFAARQWNKPVTASKAVDAVTYHRIAVLPFSTFSAGENDALLAFGLQDSVLTNLARIDALKVISRTSVMQYADKTTRNLKLIAADLGVDAILEGSLQRQGDRLLVQVQLIDGVNDQHLWAQSYDRRVDDLFTVESAIASDVAEAVRVRIGPDVRAQIAAVPTQSLDAYTEYLRAERLLDEGKDKLPDAEKAIAKALSLDPVFALAHVTRSRIDILQYLQNIDRSPERLDHARNELVAAAELQPTLPQLHIGWGRYYLYGRRDINAAATEYGMALQMLPNDARALIAAGDIHQQQGRLDQARLCQRRAVELEPRSVWNRYKLAQTYQLLRDYPSASRILDDIAKIDPDNASLRPSRAWLTLIQTGDVKAARLQLGDLDDPETLEKFAYYAGDFDEAIRQVKRQPAWQSGSTGAAAYPAIASIAFDLWLKGDKAGAKQEFRKVIPILEAALKSPDEAQWDQRTTLAAAYAVLDQAADARAQIAIVQKDYCCDNPITRSDIALGMAWDEVLLSDHDAAFAALEIALTQPAYMSWHLVDLDHIWDPLRNDPRFADLLKRAQQIEAAAALSI